tara:strand:+ start:3497 stop:4744 length:1248 start_codon:yes stop_codon:yes gene_type:complete
MKNININKKLIIVLFIILIIKKLLNKNIYYSNCKIIIIGAGVAGIKMLSELLKNGFTNVIVFEKNPDIGGVWYNNASPDIKVQTSNMVYRYLDYPPEKIMNQPSRDEILKYLNNYVKKYNLRDYIKFNTIVKKINYVGNSYIIKVCNKNSEYFVKSDYLIITSQDTNPNIPKEFTNININTIHSSKISKETLKKIKNKNNVIIGGGKSSYDLVLLLKKHNIDFKWIFRSRTKVLIYENINFKNIIILYVKSRKYLKNYENNLKKVDDIVYNKIGKNLAYAKYKKYRLDVLTKKEYDIINQTKYIQYKDIKIIDNNLILDNKNIIKNVDNLLLCTGYLNKIDCYIPNKNCKKLFLQSDTNKFKASNALGQCINSLAIIECIKKDLNHINYDHSYEYNKIMKKKINILLMFKLFYNL